MLKNAIAFLLLTWAGAVRITLAGDVEDSTIWVTDLQGAIDSAWVVASPTGSSDYFSVAHHVASGNPNGADLTEALPIVGVAVSVADFGSGRTFPSVGVYQPNLTLDPTGLTPDLSAAIVEMLSPTNPAPPLFTFVPFETSEAGIPPGSTTAVAAVKLPPGDPGLLAVGADSNITPAGTSGFSTDGYTTPAMSLTFLDLGLNPGQDNLGGPSCKASDRVPNGRLRVSLGSGNTGSGDRLSVSVVPGDELTLSFFGTMPGDRFRMYFDVFPCSPVLPFGPTLATIPDPDGDGSFRRVTATWPYLFGVNSLNFSVVWGNEACPAPGAGFTNCITIVSTALPDWGRYDDGEFEDAWVVQIPSGSSDYFNLNFGQPTSNVNGVTEVVIAPLDFVTAVPAFPTAGVSNANLAVDPSGNTPDIVSPLAVVTPFTFPSGTFATTSGAMIHHSVSVPGGALGADVHGWLQFPPGDPGLLAVAADDNSLGYYGFYTLDGYATPAISFFDLWGIRLTHN
jgi:hypothetical protein